MRLVELDTAAMVTFKEPVIAARGVIPTCSRTGAVADLADGVDSRYRRVNALSKMDIWTGDELSETSGNPFFTFKRSMLRKALIGP